MKNWLIPFFCCLCFFNQLFSQQLTPVVLSSNGGVGTSGDMQLEWTLGELAIEGLTGQPGSYTEGFHQPTLLVEQVEVVYPPISTGSDHASQTLITISPNPVATELTIRFVPGTEERFYCQVRDANGAMLSERTLNTRDGNTQIDVSDLVPGLYFIHFIAQDEGAVTVFKVVKIR
jgi:hypothetical protein